MREESTTAASYVVKGREREWTRKAGKLSCSSLSRHLEEMEHKCQNGTKKIHQKRSTHDPMERGTQVLKVILAFRTPVEQKNFLEHDPFFNPFSRMTIESPAKYCFGVNIE